MFIILIWTRAIENWKISLLEVITSEGGGNFANVERTFRWEQVYFNKEGALAKI